MKGHLVVRLALVVLALVGLMWLIGLPGLPDRDRALAGPQRAPAAAPARVDVAWSAPGVPVPRSYLGEVMLACGCMMKVWRRGAFCPLGTGAIANDAVLRGLLTRDYRGWLVARPHCGRPGDNSELGAARVADSVATRAKQAFVDVFNPLARRLRQKVWAAADF